MNYFIFMNVNTYYFYCIFVFRSFMTMATVTHYEWFLLQFRLSPQYLSLINVISLKTQTAVLSNQQQEPTTTLHEHTPHLYHHYIQLILIPIEMNVHPNPIAIVCDLFPIKFNTSA